MRNPVAKNMHKFTRPSTHQDKRDISNLEAVQKELNEMSLEDLKIFSEDISKTLSNKKD